MLPRSSDDTLIDPKNSFLSIFLLAVSDYRYFAGLGSKYQMKYVFTYNMAETIKM